VGEVLSPQRRSDPKSPDTASPSLHGVQEGLFPRFDDTTRCYDSLPFLSPRFVACPWQWQEHFFDFFGDVGGLLSTTRSLTIWTLSNGFDLLLSRHHNIFGIAFLSGPIWDRAKRVTQACHLKRIVPKTRPPNWPYRRFYRSPLSVPLGTSLGAP